MPTVQIYVPKEDAEVIDEFRRMLAEQPWPRPKLSHWTVKVWKDTLINAGRWPSSPTSKEPRNGKGK